MLVRSDVLAAFAADGDLEWLIMPLAICES